MNSLDERSQEAAEDINELASSSMTIANQRNEILGQLVPDIRKTAELVQEIKAASSEQTSGVDQINRAIQQLDHIIQIHASTSEKLANQAEQLQQAISFFTITQSVTEKDRRDDEL